MDNRWFQKITIAQTQYINIQEILVVTFEFTGAARGFMIMSGAACGVKKVGQHCLRQMRNILRFIKTWPLQHLSSYLDVE